MAVLVADSMSLMFRRCLPQIKVCSESSSLIVSTCLPSCGLLVSLAHKRIGTLSRRKLYNLVNHDQDPRLCMFADLHVAVDDDTEAVVDGALEVTLDVCQIEVQRLWVAQEDVGLCPVGDVVHVPENVCSEARRAVRVEAGDEQSIHIHRRRTLSHHVSKPCRAVPFGEGCLSSALCCVPK